MIHGDTDGYCTFVDGAILILLGSSYVLQLVAVLGVSWVGKRVGRKPTLLSSSHDIGVVLVAWFPNTVVFILGYITLNIGIGGITRVVPIIQSELAPEKWHHLCDIGSALGGHYV
ncbi:hypothetical protein vseg_018787 [Gypsophila vaccaria]